MLLREFFIDQIDEKQIWARSGQNAVRKFRCSAGPRKGRIVAKMGQCFVAPNLKAKLTMKRTRARLGGKMMRKAKRTKRNNPVSRRVQALNRAGRRR
jgi:hypothetical protein|tara:strand:- start:8926 stop:9216 length:291 start_codon:yes stop_codon:yes gene_type:complete